jgi:hypothetical protein
VGCNGEPEFFVLPDQKAWVFGFLIEDNDTFHFLSIQSSLPAKKRCMIFYFISNIS